MVDEETDLNGMLMEAGREMFLQPDNPVVTDSATEDTLLATDDPTDDTVDPTEETRDPTEDTRDPKEEETPADSSVVSFFTGSFCITFGLHLIQILLACVLFRDVQLSFPEF